MTRRLENLLLLVVLQYEVISSDHGLHSGINDGGAAEKQVWHVRVQRSVR